MQLARGRAVFVMVLLSSEAAVAAEPLATRYEVDGAGGGRWVLEPSEVSAGDVALKLSVHASIEADREKSTVTFFLSQAGKGVLSTACSLVLRADEEAIVPTGGMVAAQPEGGVVLSAVITLKDLERLGRARAVAGRLCKDELELDGRQIAGLGELAAQVRNGPGTPAPRAAPPAPLPKIGVAECDTYLESMARCAQKMPGGPQPVLDSMNKVAEAWLESAKTEEGRKALAPGCRQALGAANSVFKQMGCEFPGGESQPGLVAAQPVVKVGVDSCDRYVDAMLGCSKKMKPEGHVAFVASMGEVTHRWRDAAGTPEGRAELDAACVVVYGKARESYREKGCTFPPLKRAPAKAHREKKP